MKKTIKLTLILSSTICFIAAFTFSCQAAASGIYTYSVSSGGAIITDCHSSASGEIVVPSTLDGYPVIGIGHAAFVDDDITSITIPNGVRSIGSCAFYSCSSLKNITIPNSVTSIGNSAFALCSNLKSITIPNSVISIGFRAFENCTSLTSIVIPNSVTNMGSWAFYNCTSLSNVTLSENITSIGQEMFYNCRSLKSIVIPKRVTSISHMAFRACGNLRSITIPNSVTSIGDGTFDSCTSLTSIVIPEDVTSIGYAVFTGCSNLTDVYIYSSLAYDESTFLGCDATIHKYDVVDNLPIEDTLPYLSEKSALKFMRFLAGNKLYNPNGTEYCYFFDLLQGKLKGTSAETQVKKEFLMLVYNFVDKNFYEQRLSFMRTVLEEEVDIVGYVKGASIEHFINNMLPLVDDVVAESVGTVFDAYSKTGDIITWIKALGGIISLFDQTESRYFKGTLGVKLNYSESDYFDSIWDAVVVETGELVFEKDEIDKWTDFVYALEQELKEDCKSKINYEAESYNVTFDTNCLEIENIKHKYVPAQDNWYLPNIEREGYTFFGWYLDKACSNSASGISTTNKDLTLYARWIKNIVNIIFNSNCEYVSNYSYVYDKTNWHLPSMQRNGYLFAGWYHDKECTDLAETLTLDDDVTLFAKWEKQFDYISDGNITLTSFKYYQIQNGTIVTDIILPESIDNITVVNLGDNLFFNRELTSIEICNTVETIGKNAFANNSLLKKVIIPKSVNYIGEDAFKSCPNLTIYGYNNTVAEIYAHENNIPFVTLSPIDITDYSLLLEGSIGLKFYMDIKGTSEAIAKFVYDSTEYSAEIEEENGKYFAIYYLAPKDMSGEVTLNVSAGAESDSVTVSISDYIKYINENSEEYTESLSLVNAISDYNTYADAYFNEKSAEDVILTNEEKSKIEEIVSPKLTSSKLNGITFHSTSLILEDTTTIRHYFKIENISTFNAENYTVEGGTPLKISGEYAYTDIENIPSHKLGEQKTVKVSDGQNESDITFSVLNYVKMTYKKNDTRLSNLVKALYRYSLESTKYNS